MKLGSRSGYTLVEVMVSVLVTMTVFGSMVMTYMAVKSINTMARHKIQAMQLVRSQIESLKSSTFTSIASASSSAAYDAGADGVYGTADDMQGTLTTSIQDLMDFDSDSNVAETQINVDGSGGNDSTAVPVRVQFSWSEYVIGQSKNMTVWADTIIAQ